MPLLLTSGDAQMYVRRHPFSHVLILMMLESCAKSTYHARFKWNYCFRHDAVYHCYLLSGRDNSSLDGPGQSTRDDKGVGPCTGNYHNKYHTNKTWGLGWSTRTGEKHHEWQHNNDNQPWGHNDQKQKRGLARRRKCARRTNLHHSLASGLKDTTQLLERQSPQPSAWERCDNRGYSVNVTTNNIVSRLEENVCPLSAGPCTPWDLGWPYTK